MSVLLGDRKESKFEAITYSIELHDMLLSLMQRRRAANTIYPTTLHEYEIRRDYQNAAIVHCELLIDDLQRVAERFNVDLNLYSPHIKAIDREIGLIKRWRQRDMAIKSRLEKGNV